MALGDSTSTVNNASGDSVTGLQPFKTGALDNFQYTLRIAEKSTYKM